MDRQEHERRFAEVVAESGRRFGKMARTYADDAAEDLLQEILLQVWRSLPTFSGNSKLSTWCYRVAINTALTWRRKQSKRAAESPSDRMDRNESKPSATEQHTRSLLQRFTARERTGFNGVVLIAEQNRVIYSKTLGYADFNGKRIATRTLHFGLHP